MQAFSYGLGYLLLVLGSRALKPNSLIVPTVMMLLILLNGSVYWLTRRILKAER